MSSRCTCGRTPSTSGKATDPRPGCARTTSAGAEQSARSTAAGAGRQSSSRTANRAKARAATIAILKKPWPAWKPCATPDAAARARPAGQGQSRDKAVRARAAQSGALQRGNQNGNSATERTTAGWSAARTIAAGQQGRLAKAASRAKARTGNPVNPETAAKRVQRLRLCALRRRWTSHAR